MHRYNNKRKRGTHFLTGDDGSGWGCRCPLSVEESIEIFVDLAFIGVGVEALRFKERLASLKKKRLLCGGFICERLAT